MDIFDKISNAYDNGDELTPEMIAELQDCFAKRDKLNNIFSLDVLDSPEKMKELLEKEGYTLEVINGLKFGAKGTDLDKLNVFKAAMSENVNEFYVASAAYFLRMTNEHVDFNAWDFCKACKDKLVAKGYSKEDVNKAVDDYLNTGKFVLGKKVFVQMVRKEEKTAGNSFGNSAGKSVSPEPSAPKSVNPTPAGTGTLSAGELDDLVNSFFEQNPQFRPDKGAKALDGSQESDSKAADSNDGSKGNGDPLDEQNAMFTGQGVNPFSSSYGDVRKIMPQTTDVEYLDPYNTVFSGNFVEMPSPFEVPYEGVMEKVKKIAKKVRRPIPKPDFTKLRKAMLNSLSNLMKKASDALQARSQMKSDGDELSSPIDFSGYSMDGDKERGHSL